MPITKVFLAHFAGEHTSLRSPGIEGALEPAERAVAKMLAAPGPVA